MSEQKETSVPPQPNPVDIEAIRQLVKEGGLSMFTAFDNIKPLCDEVEALRAKSAVMQDVIELHEAHIRILKANDQKVIALWAKVKELEGKGESVCPWAEDQSPDGDPYYSTSCGGEFIMFEGGLKDNEFKFCAYCGKKIVELAKPVEPTKGRGEI